MTIVTVQFDYPPEMNIPKYSILRDVFRESVRTVHPEINFHEINIPAPMAKNPDKALNFWYNTIKLEKWLEALETIDDNIIFADCDMLMISKMPDDFWSGDWDVGYTKRTESRVRKDRAALVHWGGHVQRMPMNGGIMFAKPNERAKDFYRQLLKVNNELYENHTKHMKWNVKYAGMNQAAFGCLFETGSYKAKVQEFPCRKFNAVDTDWHAVNSETVFAHIKSKMRRLVLMKHNPYGNFKYVMQKWYDNAQNIGVPTFKD